MQQSNSYIIIFTAVVTVVIGALMSGASIFLKPMQEKQVELDTKKKILGAVLDISTITDPNQILQIYNDRVSSFVVNSKGEIITTDAKGNSILAEKVNIQKNYKMTQDERQYPVFIFKVEGSEEVEAYIFPMFGNGLWDWINGFVALERDLNTIKGIAFDHKQETPGLGARITEAEIQSRYIGKRLFSDDGTFKSVMMLKGEGNSGMNEHQVDGMSGATMTAKGVNAMIATYMKCYQPFFEKQKLQLATL